MHFIAFVWNILYNFMWCLALFEGYFWAYEAASGRCEPRGVTSAGMSTFWSVWSWSTEMFIFLLVPVAALFFNVLVIVEVRRISNTSPSSSSSQLRTRSSRSVVSIIAAWFLNSLRGPQLPLDLPFFFLPVSSFPVCIALRGNQSQSYGASPAICRRTQMNAPSLTTSQTGGY